MADKAENYTFFLDLLGLPEVCMMKNIMQRKDGQRNAVMLHFKMLINSMFFNKISSNFQFIIS